MKWSTIVCAGVLVASACAPAGGQVFHSSAGDLAVQTMARGLDHPWALAFLPDGRTLVTERPGRMRLIARDGTLSPPLGGVPNVFASGQGGLHDVVLDRGFAQNHTVYFCYAEPVDGRARTSLALGWSTKGRHGSMRSR
jgi:aldose sugar dehydrogenase